MSPKCLHGRIIDAFATLSQRILWGKNELASPVGWTAGYTIESRAAQKKFCSLADFLGHVSMMSPPTGFRNYGANPSEELDAYGLTLSVGWSPPPPDLGFRRVWGDWLAQALDRPV